MADGGGGPANEVLVARVLEEGHDQMRDLQARTEG